MGSNFKKCLIKATRVLPLLFMVYLLRFETYLYFPRSDFRIPYELVAGVYIGMYVIRYVIWPIPEEDRGKLIEVVYNLILVEYTLFVSFSQYHLYLSAVIIMLLCAAVSWLDEKVRLLAVRSGCDPEQRNRIRSNVWSVVLCMGMMIPAVFSAARYRMQAPEYTECSKYVEQPSHGVPVTDEKEDNLTEMG